MERSRLDFVDQEMSSEAGIFLEKVQLASAEASGEIDAPFRAS